MRGDNKVLLLFSTLLAFAAVVAVTSLYGQSKSDPTPTPQENATVIEEGVMTRKQKVHSKFFPRHMRGRKLRDLTTTGTGNVVVRSKISPPLIVGSPECPSYPSPGLVSIANKADAVVIGVLKSKSYSQLTENREFVFSNYELTIQDILKNNPVAPIQPNTSIYINRPRGVVQLNGRTIHAIAGGFQPFQINGRYVLFLKYIPDTGEYLAFSSGSFQLSNDRVIELIDDSTLDRDVTAFVTEIRAAITAAPCGNRPLF